MTDEPDVRDRELSPFTKKVFKASADFVEWYTTPLGFGQQQPNELDIVTADRTGIFLQVGDLHFIVTAAHDFKEFMEHGLRPCVIMPTKGLQPIYCDSEPIHFSIDPQVDLAVIRLDSFAVSYLSEHYRFLRISDLMPRDHTAHRDAVYLLTGFATALHGRDEEGIKRCEVWRYLTVPYSGDYANVESYDPALHIVVEYERDTKSREGSTVHPPGMSGCGIWFVANPWTSALFSANDFRLVGIQNAWFKKFEYAKGTWINIALKIIWRYFADSRDPMRIHGIEF